MPRGGIPGLDVSGLWPEGGPERTPTRTPTRTPGALPTNTRGVAPGSGVSGFQPEGGDRLKVCQIRAMGISHCGGKERDFNLCALHHGLKRAAFKHPVKACNDLS